MIKEIIFKVFDPVFRLNDHTCHLAFEFIVSSVDTGIWPTSFSGPFPKPKKGPGNEELVFGLSLVKAGNLVFFQFH